MHFLKIITLLTFHDRNVEHYMKLLILKAILMEKHRRKSFHSLFWLKCLLSALTQFSVMKSLRRTYVNALCLNIL